MNRDDVEWYGPSYAVPGPDFWASIPNYGKAPLPPMKLISESLTGLIRLLGLIPHETSSDFLRRFLIAYPAFNDDSMAKDLVPTLWALESLNVGPS